MTSSGEPSSTFVHFFSQAGRLKSLQRQGWLDRGVHAPESVSDHSFRLALMTLVVASGDPEIDSEHALKLAIVHDLPEAIAGDVTPFDELLSDPDVNRETLFQQAPEYSVRADTSKTEAEREALAVLTAELPADVREMLADLWEEYEAGTSPEARLVRQLDKLETWLQALEYQQGQPELVMESFRLGTERDVTDPRLVELFHAINDAFSSSPNIGDER